MKSLGICHAFLFPSPPPCLFPHRESLVFVTLLWMTASVLWNLSRFFLKYFEVARKRLTFAFGYDLKTVDTKTIFTAYEENLLGTLASGRPDDDGLRLQGEENGAREGRFAVGGLLAHGRGESGKEPLHTVAH